MVAGEDEAAPFFRQAVELGSTFWDTANDYRLGSPEEIVGRAIKTYGPREDVVRVAAQEPRAHIAPIVGATKPQHLADAVAGFDVQPTGDEISRLEEPYTPHSPAGF